VSFASQYLGRSHGKAEAWYILDGGWVYLGLKDDVAIDDLKALVIGQDVDRLLGLLHQVEVHAGEVVYVPPGVLHAIAEGIFLVELQEPEDLSILLEWRDFELDGERDGHLGLGFDLALQAIECRSRTRKEISRLVRPAGFASSVLPAAADPYFRLERVVLDGVISLDPGFAVVVMLSGAADLEKEGSRSIQLSAGNTAVAPYGFGPLTFSGRGEVLVCRPPRRSSVGSPATEAAVDQEIDTGAVTGSR
jgi:mannose-6-phosphate isomerase